MVLGITGGLGSGKSTVMKILKNQYGASIHIADEYGHEAYQRGNVCFGDIIQMFGPEILDEDGQIDRDYLSRIVYADPSKLYMLNRIIHPYVWERMEEGIANNLHNPLVVIESAILIEAGYGKICDKIWGVFCKKEIRIERLARSRGYMVEKTEAIIRQQMSEWEMRSHCDAVIENDGNVESLERQIEKLLCTK